jgi:2-haloacid dehalogenase
LPEQWATFDCYGTLIDWELGIANTFRALWPEADAPKLLDRYHEVEPRIQAGSGAPYRDVLALALQEVADSSGLPLDAADAGALGDSLPSWPPFAEVPGSLRELRERGWRTAVLSNTDPDLLDASIARIGVPFDLRITVAEAASYKPAPGHWERFFRDTGADRSRHVHVAASLFHDIQAAATLGLPAVWINRLAERSDVPRAAELPDLRGLADALDAVVAG